MTTKMRGRKLGRQQWESACLHPVSFQEPIFNAEPSFVETLALRFHIGFGFGFVAFAGENCLYVYLRVEKSSVVLLDVQLHSDGFGCHKWKRMLTLCLVSEIIGPCLASHVVVGPRPNDESIGVAGLG